MRIGARACGAKSTSGVLGEVSRWQRRCIHGIGETPLPAHMRIQYIAQVRDEAVSPLAQPDDPSEPGGPKQIAGEYAERGTLHRYELTVQVGMAHLCDYVPSENAVGLNAFLAQSRITVHVRRVYEFFVCLGRRAARCVAVRRQRTAKT